MAAVGWPDGSQRLEVTKWIHDWTGGHPFLTAKMVAAVAAEPAGDWSEARTSALAQRLFLAPGMRTNETHLHYVAGMLLSGPPGVLPTYHAILNGRLRQRPPETVVSWLTLSGAVIVLDEIGTFAVRNRIYTRVFNDAWVARHQPPAPWRVEVASYARRHGPWLVPALVLIALLGAATTTLLFREREAAARLAVTHTIRTQRIQEFMVRLFDAGETDVSPAKDLKVLALLDSGVREAGSLSAEPQVQAALYHTLGLVYQRLGQYKQADDLLTRALQMRQAQGGPASPDAVESLVAIGLLRVEQADLDEGERTLQRALELSRRAEPVPGALTARATEGMGKVKEERGAYALAIPLYEEAVRLYATTDSPEERRVQGLSSLANAQFYAGNLDESEAINRRLLQEERQRRTGDHPDIADTLLNLGAIEFSRGRYPAAAERDREALGILERWYGPDHPEAASAMTILASALSIQKQFDEAAQLLERALRTQQRIYGAEHPRVAFALNEFGSVALQRKDFASAEAAFTQALAIYRKVYSDGRHPRIGTALSNLASVYSAQEQYARAEPLFREAIRLNSEVLSPTHQNTAIAQIKLGRVLSRQRRYAEAETYLLAGYETLRVEMTPSVSWLRTAREDLAALYRALGKPDLAIRYEKESDTAGRPRPGF
jgi:tetratricopeptide (TPR) repeat protein